jgi:myo-inositol-1(or 4)-monophosphatase
MNDALHHDMLILAKRLALAAAEVSLDHLGQARVESKADRSFVTEADHAIQTMILDELGRAYADHAVVAEEDVADPGRHPAREEARYCWVVDPLDGTRNYVACMPCFGTSIAVLDRGEPVVGVVLEHNTRWMWSATAGGGVFLNDRPIETGGQADRLDKLIGIPSSKSDSVVSVLRDWVGRRGLILRNVGAAAVHLAMVASGALDAALSSRSKLWDVAAGCLMVQEAGGVVTDLAGRNPFPFSSQADPGADMPILAARKDLHELLLSTVVED